MLSIWCNYCIKSWTNRKNSWKNDKNKTFINKYKWERTNFPSDKYHWEKSEKNNGKIAVLYAKKEKIYPANVWKHTSTREKQVILLMIPDGEGQWWHYLAVKKLSALIRGITSKNNGHFYYLDCLHSFRTKNKLESYQKVSENKDFCNVIMSSEEIKILELNQYQKRDKAHNLLFR